MEIYKATSDKMLSVKYVRQQAGVLEKRMERMCWSQQDAIGEKSEKTQGTTDFGHFFENWWRQ